MSTQSIPIPPHLATKRYRPSLTYMQILHILSLAKTDPDLTSETITIIGIMDRARVNIENGVLGAAYEVTPPRDKQKSMLESLGELAEATADVENHIAENTPPDVQLSSSAQAFSKEAWWKVCYQKYQVNPAKCTLEEISNAREHMYLEELMSADEIAEFEKDMIDIGDI